MRNVPVERIKEFEKLFLGELGRKYPEVLENFRAKKYQEEDLAKLESLAGELTPQFK